MPRRTRVLIALFFLVYAIAAGGLTFREGGPLGPVEELVVASVGGLAIAAIFGLARARQRSDLRDFVDSVFREIARI